MTAAGTIALLLHYADDEAHARRAHARMLTWVVSDGWGVVEDVKRAVEETREEAPPRP